MLCCFDRVCLAEQIGYGGWRPASLAVPRQWVEVERAFEEAEEATQRAGKGRAKSGFFPAEEGMVEIAIKRARGDV